MLLSLTSVAYLLIDVLTTIEWKDKDYVGINSLLGGNCSPSGSSVSLRRWDSGEEAGVAAANMSQAMDDLAA